MSICKKHPRYKGARKSKTNCIVCKFYYGWKRLLKACGYGESQLDQCYGSSKTKKAPATGDFLFIGGPCHGAYRSVELPADKPCEYNDTYIYFPHHLVAHQPSPSGAPHKVFILDGFSWDAAKEYFTIVSKALEDAAKECRGALSAAQDVQQLNKDRVEQGVWKDSLEAAIEGRTVIVPNGQSAEQAIAQQAAALRAQVSPPLIKPVSNEQVRNIGPDAKVD